MGLFDGDPFGDFVRNAQNALNIGAPTINQAGDRFNQVLGIQSGSLGDKINSGINAGAKFVSGYYQAIGRGVSELYNEVTGFNRQRQQDWQNRVAADAEAQRLKQIADNNLAAQNADTAASYTAQMARLGPTGNNAGIRLGWSGAYGPDTTDFLGL